MLVKRLLEIRWTVNRMAFNFRMTGMTVARVSYPVASFAIADVSVWTSVAPEQNYI